MPARTCPTCGNEMPTDAPLGRCPFCLIGLGLERCVRCDAVLAPATVGQLCTRCAKPDAPQGAASNDTTVMLEDYVSPLQHNPSAPVSTAEEPKRLGDYVLREVLGKGGMGEVYRASHRDYSEHVVALKMIKVPLTAGRSDFLKRFSIEIRAVAALDHDNIVRIYHAGEENGCPYFTMQFIEGRDLHREIHHHKQRQLQFPVRRAVELVAAIARAVHHAHERGILHRDLKPGNILLDSEGKPHVTDFGLAKMLLQHIEPAAGATFDPAQGIPNVTGLTKGVMGTPGYTSAEQAEGPPAELTTGSDVFSLGAILYQLLTGAPPLPTTPWRTTAVWEEYVRQARAGTYKKPSSLNSKAGPDLDAICARCLAPDLRSRARSAADLANQLDHWLNGEPLDSNWRQTPLPERVHKWVRRHRTATALIASLIMVGSLVFSGGLIRREAIRQKSLAQERKLHGLLGKADSALFNGDTPEGLQIIAQVLRESPEHSVAAEWLINVLRRRPFLVPVGPPIRTNRTVDIQEILRFAHDANMDRQAAATNETIELKDLRTGQRRSLVGHKGLVRSVAFSPNGQLIVSASDDGTAVVWDAATAEIRVSWTHPAALRQAEFSPDGQAIVTACLDGTARLWNLQSRQHDGEQFPHGSPLSTARFSSDGGWVVTTSEESGTVRVWDIVTRRLLAEPVFLAHAVDARFSATNRTGTVETDAGEVYSFRLTHTAPLERARSNEEVPPATLPLPVTYIFGIAASNFHAGLITMFEVSPDSNLLATASNDGIACLWGMRPLNPSAGPIHRLQHRDSDNLIVKIVNCVHFTRDGRRLVTSTADRKVRVWDTRTGLPLTDWLQFDEPVEAVNFSVDGTRIITSSGLAWELNSTSGIAPNWLPRLAEALADKVDAGSAKELSELRYEIGADPRAAAAWAKRLLETP